MAVVSLDVREALHETEVVFLEGGGLRWGAGYGFLRDCASRAREII